MPNWCVVYSIATLFSSPDLTAHAADNSTTAMNQSRFNPKTETAYNGKSPLLKSRVHPGYGKVRRAFNSRIGPMLSERFLRGQELGSGISGYRFIGYSARVNIQPVA